MPIEKRWVVKPQGDPATAAMLAAALRISPVLANLLVQRGIDTVEKAEKFFKPSLADLHDPFLMKDMEKAVERVERAVANQEKIMVYGDYDVDGCTAVALVYKFLRQIGHKNLMFYIPDRYTEGYGISIKGIDLAARKGVGLIIALDCGIKATEKVVYAKTKGVDFIICDHHLPAEEIPKAVAVLDPKRVDCSYPFDELSGCGVGFKLVQAYAQKNRMPFEQILPLLDLLVVSIASDIVPLVGENRILAYFGLKNLNREPSKGLLSIIKICGLDKHNITIDDIVFKIGPRINAAGRMRMDENDENAAPMYDYTYIGQATNTVADPNANSAGVSEDERGGIKPSSDNVLFSGVLSEAHMKLTMIAGVECLFRIASVRYGENGRSRLVVHTKTNGTWSAPTPVDFSLGFGEGDVERNGIFDYDFDVVEYTDGRRNQDAYVLLVSGERPAGDNTLFDTASTSGILSVVRLRISNDGVRVISHTSWRSISRGRLQEDGYHCLQCPRITVGKTLVDGRLSGAYLHRRGATAEKALGSEAEVALECFTLWSDVSGDSLTFRQVLRFPQAPSSIELGTPENINGKMVVPVAYETADGCGCASYAVIGQSIAGWGVMSPDAAVPHAVPWPQHTGFLATVNEQLQHITWARGASAFATQPVGAAGCGPASFSVSNNGRCVLYVENTDGKVGQTYDEEGNPVAVMGKHFRIFASTLAGDLFTEPFVMCELDHPVDQITTFLTSGGMLSALATHIVSAEKSEAELHGIEVPLVACATPTGAVATSGAVVPGAAGESFMVTVRNDGNTLLTAGTIDLYREGSSQPFSSASIGFGTNARMASIYDPELAENASANDMAHVKYALETLGARFATHPLVADNGNAVLAPGCTAQFRMSFAIPESWSDEVGKRVTLYAKARNLVALDPVTLEEIRPGANSALGAILHELHVPDAACERSEVQVGVCDSADTTGLHDAPMTVDGDGGSSGGGTDEGGGSSGSSSGS